MQLLSVIGLLTFLLPLHAVCATVFIDPGHGGKDPGAVVEGIREKDVVLAFSQTLAAALRDAGFTVAKSRDDDRYVSLSQRVTMARSANADILLSIHADEVTQGNAAGLSLYRLSSEATDALAAALAEQANGPQPDDDPLLGLPHDLRPALAALVSAETDARTDILATTMLKAMGEAVPLLNGRPLRAAAFRVLMAPDTPSLLIELGFLSDSTDRARLTDPAWRAAAVSGIVTGVQRWFSATQGRLCATGACQDQR